MSKVWWSAGIFVVYFVTVAVVYVICRIKLKKKYTVTVAAGDDEITDNRLPVHIATFQQVIATEAWMKARYKGHCMKWALAAGCGAVILYDVFLWFM